MSSGLLPSCVTVVLDFQHRLLHPSDLDPCFPFRTMLRLKMMRPLCTSSRRSNALFATVVLVLIAWVALYQWETVDNQRGRPDLATSHMHLAYPSSGSLDGPSHPSSLPPPSNSSASVSNDLSASNSTLGVRRNALRILRPITDLPLLNGSLKLLP